MNSHHRGTEDTEKNGEADRGVEAAWAAEIERRVAAIEAGTAKLEPWEQVKQRIEKEILRR